MATKLSGMNRETYIIPKNSVKTIDYKDVEPNYFHIQNLGGTPLYFSSHTIPTTRIYDVKIDGGSIATFTDPYPQYEVYIFNPSTTDDINIIMTSFKAPFDPVVLAQANKQISIGGTVETDGVIKGFNTALPAGTNKIGKVDISSLPSIPAGSNKIGKVDIASLPSIPAGTNNIGKVTVPGVSVIESNTTSANTKFDNMITLLQGLQDPDLATYDVEGYCVKLTSGTKLTPPTDRYFSKILKLSNNTNTTLSVTLNPYDSAKSQFSTIELPANSDYDLNMNAKVVDISATATGLVVAAETKPYKIITETIAVDSSGYTITEEKLKADFSIKINALDESNPTLQATVYFDGNSSSFSSIYLFQDVGTSFTRDDLINNIIANYGVESVSNLEKITIDCPANVTVTYRGI